MQAQIPVAQVSAFGYTVPLTIILVFIALVIGLALAVLFWLTIGLSVYRSVQSTRKEQVRDELQDQLLDGVFDTETEWQPWVDGLSRIERAELEALLDKYLRELDGQNRERLRELGAELGIPNRSAKQLQNRGEYRRLYALTWLTLLEQPEKFHETDFTPTSPRERASVARLRYESDDFETPREGISLLLSDANSQFSVFGQDTLYQIAMADPEALFEVSAANYDGWSDSLLIQVLVVCQHLTSVTTENLSWVLATLEHESEAVREAAMLALSNVGWRTDVREDQFLNRLLNDDSPRVRGAVYQTLARWGDAQAVDILVDELRAEQVPRARLVGTDALVTKSDSLGGDIPTSLSNTWRWSSEHAEYDSVARNRTMGVSD
jgi:hypothetical protein